MTGDFAERVVIVTGAASGIGRATALLLRNRGAAVIGVDRDGEGLAALAREDGDIDTTAADVTDHAALARCVDATIGRHGRIDVLINNAGFSEYARHADSTLDQWRRTMAVNVEAMYALTRLVTPHMIAARYGRIVNIAST
jgi:NAD(P)-dependent dehydrogenase (short-subunit alcohol dehydrogenase family)